MMLRVLMLAGVACAIAAAVPSFLGSIAPSPSESPAGPEAPLAADTDEAGREAVRAPLGRAVHLPADGRGHFTAEFRMNGRRIEALVDTGATVVAINRSTAARIGLSLASSDFVHEVNTANGKARAAGATIERLEIGRIEVRDVPAVVLEDRALDGTLIGMSFLSRLGRFEMKDGALVLEQ